MSEQRQEQEITMEEFRNWQENNVTRLVVDEIILHLDLLKNHLANGGTLSKDSNESTDRIVGRIEGMRYLFDMFTNGDNVKKERIPYGE
jgi:hypothetical protein